MMPAHLAKANETRRKQLIERVEKALQEPTLAKARASYGGTSGTFYRAVNVAGKRDEYERKFGEERKEIYRKSIGRATGEANDWNRLRTAALLEDAEWMARTGENIDRAAERLGHQDRRSLEALLHRNGRTDLLEAFERNEVRPYWRRGRVAA
jgi:hypothetical protein